MMYKQGTSSNMTASLTGPLRESQNNQSLSGTQQINFYKQPEAPPTPTAASGRPQTTKSSSMQRSGFP